jgi:hypothetical protein
MPSHVVVIEMLMTRLLTASLIALAFLAAGAWLSVGSASADEPISDSPTGTVEPIIEPVIAPVTETAAEPVIETIPVTQTIAHVTDPIVETSAPTTDPIIGTVAPTTEHVVDILAPVTEPVAETIAPVTEPVAATIAPTIETVAPTTKPVVETVAAVTQPVTEAAAQATWPSLEPVPRVAAPSLENMVQEPAGVPSRNSRPIVIALSTAPPASLESAPAIHENARSLASVRIAHTYIQALSSDASGSFSPRASPHTVTAALFGALLVLFAGSAFRRLSTSDAVFLSVAYAPLTPPA